MACNFLTPYFYNNIYYYYYRTHLVKETFSS